MSLRCHLGYHDHTWKRESYRGLGETTYGWGAPPILIYYRQVGTCQRCGKVKHKNLGQLKSKTSSSQSLVPVSSQHGQAGLQEKKGTRACSA